MFNYHVFLMIFSILMVRSVAKQCSAAVTCVTDYAEKSCAIGETLQYDPDVLFGCCPVCRSGKPEAGKCRPPASCLLDGTYASVQCKGDLFTGRCFCSDESGNRIFGQMWKSDATGMNCECSKRRAQLEAMGGPVTLHCTPAGDYEAVQCDKGLCWCAEAKTGQPTVPPVLQKNMKLLPCYTASFMGDRYLRRCESVVQALASIHKEQSNHGTEYLSTSATICDYDGSYGSYKIQGSSAYCTSRDGAILGAWSVEASKSSEMNCNCARDTSIYFPDRGMTVVATCESNGNYKKQQNIGDYVYCVDSDGYQTICSNRHTHLHKSHFHLQENCEEYPTVTCKTLHV